MTTLDELKKEIDSIKDIYKEWLYDFRRNETKSICTYRRI
jgi:hypothetical protein